MRHGSVAAVAICPHPPMLVPEVASGAAHELSQLHQACQEAIDRMYRTGVPAVLVLAGAADTRRYAPGSGGDFGRYGVPGVGAGFGDPPHDNADPPLGLLTGAWLLARGNRPARRFGQTVATTAAAAACGRLGRALDADHGLGRVGLLVMRDGSARRSDRAPGAFHPDAEAFDRSVAAALGGADTDALRDLAPGAADTLMVAGRAPWQVLAGAAEGRAWRPELHYHDAPYGVAYFVASWSPA
ncbi:MAG TPA: class III extradiol dioxygenase subunit B-like domain-containing protein [Micromonosporaceae bacterium]